MSSLDQFNAFVGKPAKAKAESSAKVQQMVSQLRQMQRASYDAAANTDDFSRYWANADRFDADSANSREIRHTLISRSRYEVTNNGYSDGIAQTSATDLIGVGPTLRMQTGSQAFNQMVEREFWLWWKATQMRRKLWTMAHAKHVDGEAFGVLRMNPRVNHRIKLDVVLYEAEQFQTPFIPFDDPGYIDGIHFDEFDNAEWYDLLPRHPGASNGLQWNLQPNRVPAERVLHWYKLRRPGQHRGVPECASTLNLGAAFRRLREASLSTAEKIAAWTLFLKTMYQPDTEDAQGVDAMSTLDIVHGMMTALPNTVEPYQLKAEQPGPMYDSFHKTLLNEQARPKSMPFNKAACDSSDYNYASGRLDHQTYYAVLDVDREDCNELVLDRVFDTWFDISIATFGWLGGDALAIGPGARVHMWDWPKHRVADVESEANANKTRLLSGQVFLHQLYTDSGLDLDDEITKAATHFRVDEEEFVKRLLDVILPPPKTAAPEPAVNGVSDLIRRMSLNGVNHG